MLKKGVHPRGCHWSVLPSHFQVISLASSQALLKAHKAGHWPSSADSLELPCSLLTNHSLSLIGPRCGFTMSSSQVNSLPISVATKQLLGHLPLFLTNQAPGLSKACLDKTVFQALLFKEMASKVEINIIRWEFQKKSY